MVLKQYAQKASAVLIATALFVAPAGAQFGVSVDPVQSGHAIVQIGNEVKQLGQGVQMVQNGVKIATTTTNAYQLAQYERQALTNRYGWMQITGQLTDDFTQNKYGETTNWGRAMNGSVKDVQAAYGVASVALQNPVWVKGMPYSNGAATLASVEAYNSAIVTAMAQVSQQRATARQNQQAQSFLASQIVSTNPLLNTAKAQANLTNGALMQQVSATNQQTQALTAANSLQIVNAMQQNNAATEHLNNITEAQSYYADNTGEHFAENEAKRKL